MGFKRKSQKFVTPDTVLKQVVKNLGIDERMREMELLGIWQEVAGEKLASKTFAHRITRDKKIVIGVNSAVLANELQFLKAGLEKKFNELAELKLKRKINGIVFELREA